MNFLAHLYLSDRTDGSMLGALYGDFLKGSRVQDFAPEIQAGIRLHQFIDTFTDDHPIFRQSKRRIQSERRRYSGVLIDIFYDHFLATSWPSYSSQSLESFTEEVYGLLKNNFDQLPHRLQTLTPILIRENWLMSYGTEEGLAQTFQRLSQRIKRQNSVHQSLLDLDRHYQFLSEDFSSFFPDLQAAVQAFQSGS